MQQTKSFDADGIGKFAMNCTPMYAEIDKSDSSTFSSGRTAATRERPCAKWASPEFDSYQELTRDELIILLASKYMPPKDIYQSFPMVSKRFNQFVKRHFPRIILVKFCFNSGLEQESSFPLESPQQNLHQQIRDSDTVKNCLANTECKKIKLSQVKALDSWQHLPDSVEKYFESSRSGLSMVFEIVASALPAECAQVKKMIACMRGAVDTMLSRVSCSNQSKKNTTDIMVLPWEFSVDSDYIAKSPQIVYKLQKLLQLFDIKKLELVDPDEFSLKLLKKDIEHLKLKKVSRVIDLTRLGSLCHLKSLVLTGPGPEIDIEEYFEPQAFTPLINLASHLQKLAICQWFPLSKYSGLMPILCNLVQLKELTVFGLYQGDQEPQELAYMMYKLPNLEIVNQLGYLNVDFWMNFCKFTDRKGHARLKHLTIELDVYMKDMFVGKTLMACTKLLPALESLELVFTDTDEEMTTPSSAHTPHSVSSSMSDMDCNEGCSLESESPMKMSPQKVSSQENTEHSNDCQSEQKSNSIENSSNIRSRLTASRVLYEIHGWYQTHRHPAMKNLVLAGLDLSLDAIEKLAAFNFSNKKLKIEIKSL